MLDACLCFYLSCARTGKRSGQHPSGIRKSYSAAFAHATQRWCILEAILSLTHCVRREIIFKFMHGDNRFGCAASASGVIEG